MHLNVYRLHKLESKAMEQKKTKKNGYSYNNIRESPLFALPIQVTPLKFRKRGLKQRCNS